MAGKARGVLVSQRELEQNVLDGLHEGLRSLSLLLSKAFLFELGLLGGLLVATDQLFVEQPDLFGDQNDFEGGQFLLGQKI